MTPLCDPLWARYNRRLPTAFQTDGTLMPIAQIPENTALEAQVLSEALPFRTRLTDRAQCARPVELTRV